MKILTIVGARPQFVKAAVVSRAVHSFNSSSLSKIVTEEILHTGQHYDINMSDIFFEEMKIPHPKYRLSIEGRSHAAMTGQMLEKIESVMLASCPDLVLVYGDTNSTLAGALAASKLSIPIAHVEAGLRSFNMKMPEEINRIVTDRISTFLFCPTETSVTNLVNEGIESNTRIHVQNTGDVMYDATLLYRETSQPSKEIRELVRYIKRPFYLSTVHRAENTNDLERLSSIIEALQYISTEVPVVLPLHPRTKKLLGGIGDMSSLILLSPVGYFDMIHLLKHCKAVFTDSGGLQKEAFFFQRPCVTLRDETEWLELINGNFNRLVSAKKELIIQAHDELQSSGQQFDFGIQLYGNGKAGQKIVNALLTF